MDVVVSGVWGVAGGGGDPGVLPPAASAVCGDNNRPSEGTEVIDRGGLWRRSFNPGRETHQSTSEVNRPAFRPPSVTDVCWRCQCSAGKHGAPQEGYDIYCIPLSLFFLFCSVWVFYLLSLHLTGIVRESLLCWIVCWFTQAIILFGRLYTLNRSCQESALHYPPVCCEAAAAAATSEGASLLQV